MPLLHIVGVDPGLVHTGVVGIRIDPDVRAVYTDHAVVSGIDAEAVFLLTRRVAPLPHVFIEKYVPRQHYGTDERMVQGEAALKKAIPKAVFLRNTGVKALVTPQVLSVLGLTRFSTTTHHQDLLSAARIAVLGMMKDPELNRALADVVMDHIDKKAWPVVDMGGSYVS